MLDGVFLGYLDRAPIAVDFHLSIAPDGVRLSIATLAPPAQPVTISSAEPAVIAFAAELLTALARFGNESTG
ncbi:MAG: hypothetical protein IT335_00670 [Thermomicrobiales bacterium]|nr:hypothetical protein [Thermomicrobiales bacterium]